MSVNNSLLDDIPKYTRVDLEQKTHSENFYPELFTDKGSKQNRVYIMGELTYNEARRTIDHISEGFN